MQLNSLNLVLELYNLLCTVVGDYINTMKTTFDFNFNLDQAFKQHEHTKNGNKEKL